MKKRESRMQNIWKDFLKRKELAALIIVVSAMIFNSLGMQQGGMEIATHYTEFGIIAGIIVALAWVATVRIFKSLHLPGGPCDLPFYSEDHPLEPDI